MDMVDLPTRGEVGEGRTVPDDIFPYAEWIRLRVCFSKVVGHHRGLTTAQRCFQEKTRVYTNELMERLTPVLNRGGDEISSAM